MPSPFAAPVATDTNADRGIEPLFAHDKSRWLRIWAATQGAALVVACFTLLGRAGSVDAFLASPKAPRTFAIVAALVVYHVVGLRAHDWILRRPWAVITFVPLGWAIVLSSISLDGPFGLLMLGAIIQGFLFLPFAWAMTTLCVADLALVTAMIVRSAHLGATVTVATTSGVLATGVMIGTVMTYIHHVNRDSAIRARLLRDLDAAQRDLAERAKEAGVQEERQRLARDIHDTLAQGFASVIRHLEAIELSLASPPADETARDALARVAPHLAHAQSVSRTSLAEIRRLLWALRPTPLTDSTLGAAVARIVAQWSEANGIPATCTVDDLPALPPDADVIFLRAAQEALSNVARHAAATRVSVTLHCVDEVVLLTVEDDGRGLGERESAGEGKIGIAGMRERVRRFGGHVLIESAPGNGTSLTVALPLASFTPAAS